MENIFAGKKRISAGDLKQIICRKKFPNHEKDIHLFVNFFGII